MMIISAAIVVFFVNNIIAVNSLVVTQNNIRNEINKTATVNNNLQTEIERLSNYDNLKPTTDKLKLSFPADKPKKIIVQKSEIENLSQ